MESSEHFHEYLLRQILLGLQTGAMTANDGDDEWVKHFDEFLGYGFITCADGAENVGCDRLMIGIHWVILGAAIFAQRVKTRSGPERYENFSLFLKKEKPLILAASLLEFGSAAVMNF